MRRLRLARRWLKRAFTANPAFGLDRRSNHVGIVCGRRGKFMRLSSTAKVVLNSVRLAPGKNRLTLKITAFDWPPQVIAGCNQDQRGVRGSGAVHQSIYAVGHNRCRAPWNWVGEADHHTWHAMSGDCNNPEGRSWRPSAECVGKQEPNSSGSG